MDISYEKVLLSEIDPVLETLSGLKINSGKNENSIEGRGVQSESQFNSEKGGGLICILCNIWVYFPFRTS